MFAYRYTTNQRKALSVYNSISSLTAVGSGVNLVNSWGNIFKNPSGAGEDLYSRVTNSFGNFCKAAAKELPETSTQLNSLGSGFKIASNFFVAKDITEALNSSATVDEFIETNVFSYASSKYSDISINISNKGLLDYTGEGNSENFSNVLNAIYNTFTEMTSEFDLSTKEGKNEAVNYINNNIDVFRNQINTQINEVLD